MGTGQACPHRSHQDARKVALDPARGQKLFRGALEPAIAITTSEALLQQRLENPRCAVRMVPDQLLGVKLGPAFLKNSETRFGILDRKSTRLNSSHVSISYAVFCLKKKN